jgi:CubicO group peptidase (beta-lactamase class C family)
MMQTRNATRRRPVLVLFLWLLAALPLQAQTSSPAGRWEGAITLPGARLAFHVDLEQAAAGWAGRITIPQQGARDLPLEDVLVEGATLSFRIPGVPGDPTFRGTLAEDGRSISGTMTQGGQTFPVSLERVDPPAAAAAAALHDFDAWLEAAMEAWKVPGMGIAIVRNGEVVLSRGYGVRDVAARQPVTERTLFAIGSSSKAFTTLAMGQLVDEGKLGWEEPAWRYLPGLRLHDEYVSLRLTPLDMVTHRSGLPRHDLAWYNASDYDDAAVLARLPDFVPNRQLRQQFQYNNHMYALAGQLVARVDGRSWEESVRTRIFEPLGMRRSNFSVLQMQADPDHALPYGEAADTLRRLNFRSLSGAIAPAGAINSSAEEMAAWVLLHLNGGRVGERQVVNQSTLRYLYTPHMVISALPPEPELSPRTYGAGWFLDSYRGHFRVEHGGNIDGFSALVAFFPHDGLGIVALANKNGTPLPQFVVRNVADRMLGLPIKDWSGEAVARQAAARERARESQQRAAAARVTGTRPAHPLAAYAGDYEHPAYGRIHIAHAGNRLSARYNAIDTPLEHWHFEVFNGLENPVDPAFRNMKFTFQTNLEGKVDGVVVPFEPSVDPIVFRRSADVQLTDSAYVARFAGEYRLGEQAVTVTRSGARLSVTLPNQPTYELEPGRDNEFALRGMTGFRVQFVMDGRGRVTEMVFKQPNGHFPARRVD